MVHVILMILKILGIILLILLGIILLILLLVLLVPARYKISGSYKKGEKPYVKLDVTWLLHFVLYRMIYDGSISENGLKVLGIKVYPKPEKKNEKKTEEKNSEKDIKKEEIKEEPKKEADNKPDEEIKKLEKQEKPDEAKESQESAEKEKTSAVKKIIDKIKLFFANLKAKIEKSIASVKEKVTGVVNKVTDIRGFIQDEENIAAVVKVLGETKHLLLHIRPRKLRITGELGFDDPALTGKIFGVMGVLSAYYKENIDIKANFEEPVIDIEFYTRGRLFAGYVVIILVNLFLNKRIRGWVLKK